MGDKEGTAGDARRKPKEIVKETTPAEPRADAEASSEEDENSGNKKTKRSGAEPPDAAGPGSRSEGSASRSRAGTDVEPAAKGREGQPTLAERLQFERRPPRKRRL
jgi:hypothetical protein